MPTKPIRVLLIEDVEDDAELMLLELRRAGYDPASERVETAAGFRAALAGGAWDVVLCDNSLPGFDAGAALEILRETGLDVPLVVVSGTIGEERAVGLMRAGAADYLVKGNLARLAPAVEREVREAEGRRQRLRAEQAARDLAALVEWSDDAIVGLTTDGTVTAWNPGAERLFGYAAADVIGGPVPFLAPPDRAGEQAAVLGRVGRGERVDPYETVRLRKDGTRVDVAISVAPVRDAAGAVVGVSAVSRDITARKEAEDALRASEERYRHLADAMPQIVWVARPDGYHEFYNRQWYDYTGLDYEQTKGEGWNHVFHPDDQPLAWERWRHALATGDPYEIEYRCRRHDGEYRWFLGRALPQRDEAGRIIRWFGTCTDIHDFKRVEAERAELLARLNVQIERMPLAYLLTGPDFRYTRWNPAAERTFGFSQAEVLGKHPFEVVVPPPSRPLFAGVFDRLAAGDMDIQGACENVTRDGRAITCEWHNTPLFNPDGTFQGLLSLAQDVTAQRSLEEQFRQAQKMEAVGRLAGGVAHDFNNLLTIINGYSDMLGRELAEDHTAREYATEIAQAGGRAADLTRQLLAFSRQTVLEPKVLDPNALIRDLERMLRRLIGEDIDLTTRLAPDLGRVRADPGQLEQAVMNLCVNARDAMPRGGTITMETGNVDLDAGQPDVRPGPYVMLAVGDTGAGMTPEVQSRIFEPFFTTKEQGKGTGLGLAMVYGFVKQSGGHVTVESEPGRGATFKLYFPRVGEERPVVEEGLPPPGQMPRGTETVLLVEDEAALRALGKRVLQRCGYTVLAAGSGPEAVRVLAEHAGPIHLLVTDVVMPGGMGGRQVAEAVVARHPEAPVVFMSGYADDAVVRHGVLEHGTHFLQKPFAMTALAVKVREVLDSVSDADRP